MELFFLYRYQHREKTFKHIIISRAKKGDSCESPLNYSPFFIFTTRLLFAVQLFLSFNYFLSFDCFLSYDTDTSRHPITPYHPAIFLINYFPLFTYFLSSNYFLPFDYARRNIIPSAGSFNNSIYYTRWPGIFPVPLQQPSFHWYHIHR